MKSNQRLNEFWKWFSENAKDIAAGSHPETLQTLDEKLRSVDPRLSWEIGPGRHEPWLLSISPNLDRDLVEESRTVVKAAHEVPGWEIYAMRQPKQWDYEVEIDEDGSSRPIHLNASDWQFVLLRYPDGFREVLLAAPNLPNMTGNQRWQAAAIVLEGVLGEETLMDKVDNFELVSKLESRFAGRFRPINLLRDAVS